MILPYRSSMRMGKLLFVANKEGYEAIAKVLLDNNVDADAREVMGRMAHSKRQFDKKASKLFKCS